MHVHSSHGQPFAKLLQLLEISTPRRYRTKVFLTRQATLPLYALHRGYTSELHGTLFIKLLKLKPRSNHRVAHRAAHRWEPCEICVVVEILRSENVSHDQVVREAGEGLARVSPTAALALFLSRASFLTGHRVGGVDGFVSASCASLCLEASENVRYDKIPRRIQNPTVVPVITKFEKHLPSGHHTGQRTSGRRRCVLPEQPEEAYRLARV